VEGLAQPPIRSRDSWAMQLGAYHYAMDKPAVMLPLKMGRGKSKAAVDVIINRNDRRILIVCPKSVLGVWLREFTIFGDGNEKIVILDKGSTKFKAEQLDRAIRNQSDKRLIIVINYDSIWRKPLGDLIMCAGFDCVVMDESHKIKSAQSKASRYAYRLGKIVKHKMCLTGTPLPHSPLDAYGQYRFLSSDVFGSSFALFRARYAICDPVYKSSVRSWINQDDFSRRFYSVAYQPRDEDDIDLPPVTHDMRVCQLPPRARRVYAELEAEFIAGTESGIITASNSLVKLLRLQQITSGFVTLDPEDGEAKGRVEKLHNEKRHVLIEILSDLPINEPFVVFCRFRPDIEVVKEVAKDMGRNYGEISGRQKDITEFCKMPDSVDLMAAQIQSGGIGIDLTRAAYVAYMSIGFSLGEFDQSVARLCRPGQTRPVICYHILVENSVDQKVYKAIKDRRKVIETVMDYYKNLDKENTF